MPDLRGQSRRNFLTHSITGAVALAAGVAQPSIAESSLAAKSRVVVARDTQLHGTGSSIDPQRLQILLDRAILALFVREHAPEIAPANIVAAWRRVVLPTDRVGLKVNTLGGRGISTNPELVAAICERLQQAGVKPANIIVWDRDTEELERVGFRIAIGGNCVQCYGTDRLDYEDYLASWGNVGSCLSKILTRSCGVLINLPILKDHDGAGVTIALKNMYGVIHNPNKYHPNGCNPYVADVNMLPEIRSRMKIVICDATTAMYDGGPGFKPELSWKYNGLLVSQDPVALDYTGWQIIEHKRREMGLKTLEAEQRAPLYIATAADSDHRLGHCDPNCIAVVEA